MPVHMEPGIHLVGCLEIYWTLRSPKGGLLHCSLHQMGKVYQVRVGYVREPPLRTRRVVSMKAAVVAAEKFKTLALNIGYLERHRSGSPPTPTLESVTVRARRRGDPQHE